MPPDHTAMELATSIRLAVLGSGVGLEAYCDLLKVCQAGGFVTNVLENSEANQLPEALLVPRIEGTFTIVIRCEDSRIKANLGESRIHRQRSRFSIAHEIGHSFFYDRSARPPKKLTNDSVREERFCDKFASALLVPPKAIAHH